MKLNQTKKNVSRSGDFKTKGFTIAANAHAFDILSSKLYTDVRLAIVRELSTNASDAHREAGNQDKPFDVHLPNSLEPFFSIRDYGTGLSQADVESVYTTYFESTRNTSNDYTGALGLGSKSPFAYTDSFSVIAYFNGEKTTYSAHKNESGEPTISLLGSSNTNEPNGLEIKISMKSQYDHNDFVKSARNVYRFFDVQPNITGARPNTDFAKPVVDKPEYQLYNSDASQAGVPSKISVVMGQICYDASGGDMPYDLQNKLGYHTTLVIFADIGECSIAASREELHYDDKTNKTINSLMKTAFEDAKVELEKTVSHCKTKLEKIIAMQEYSNIISIPNAEQTLKTTKKDEYEGKRIQFQGDRLYIDNYDSYLRPYGDTKYIFIEDDGDEFKQRDRNRLRYWLISQSHNHRYGSNVYLFKIEDAAAFEETFGECVIKLSDIPAPPKKPRAPRVAGISPKFIKRLRTSGNGRIDGNLEDVGTMDKTDAVCVPKKGNYAIWGGEIMRPDVVREIATTCGYTNVYFITISRYDKMRKDLGLPDLETAAKEYAEDYVKNVDDYQVSRLEFKFNNSWDNNFCPAFLKALPGLSDECDGLVGVSEATEITAGHKRLLNRFELELPKGINYQEAFYKKYPLLRNLHINVARAEHAVNYIKMTEEL